MIKVTYYYSACVGIEAPDLRVLCDPWFTEGAYDGSWYHYPPVSDPISMVGEWHYIYVSHIHPDHFDPDFIRSYLCKYPNTEVLIAPFEKNFLSKKMAAMGIPCRVVDTLTVGDASLKLFPNERNPFDIDSALGIKWRDQSVVNMNDNLYCQDQVDRIKAWLEGRPSIALLGYTGAGPYPQTYFKDREVLQRKAEEKKLAFFDRYRTMRQALNPRVAIPFAGKYILGGKLHELNEFRGVADAVEVTQFDPTAVVLADGGHASIDTETLRPTAERRESYSLKEMRAYASTLRNQPMEYERYFAGLDLSKVQYLRLLGKAYENAYRLVKTPADYYFCIKIPTGWFTFNIRESTDFKPMAMESVEHLTPRSEIDVDPRYLFGLLTGVFHWNNAEVGSQYFTNRVPDGYNPTSQTFLSFFHV